MGAARGAVQGSPLGYQASFFLMALPLLVAWFLGRTTQELPALMAPGNGLQPKAWDLLREPMFRRLMATNGSSVLMLMLSGSPAP